MYIARPSRGFGAASGGQDLTAAGAAIMAAAPFTGPAAPFVAIGGLIVEFLGQMGVGSGCGQTCVLSTQYANQAEGYLRQNLAAYQALALPRPLSAQTAALKNFDTIWADLVKQCGNPNLGDAGRRCISDRQAGSSAYHDAAGNPWNWFIGYRDPLTQGAVYDDSASVGNLAASASSALSSSVSVGGVSVPLVALLAAAAVGIWAVTS